MRKNRRTRKRQQLARIDEYEMSLDPAERLAARPSLNAARRKLGAVEKLTPGQIWWRSLSSEERTAYQQRKRKELLEWIARHSGVTPVAGLEEGATDLP